MNRPWQIWLAFAFCASLAVAAMAWLTREAVCADVERTLAARRAELEQNVSLVLWRMDTKLAPLIAEEVARPPEFFQSGADLASVPMAVPNHVVFNFSCPSSGGCASPQVPDQSQEQFAIANGYPPQLLASNKQRLANLSSEISFDKLLGQLPELTVTTELFGAPPTSDNSYYWANAAAEQLPAQAKGGAPNIDLAERSKRYQDVAQQEFRKQRAEAPNSPAAQTNVTEQMSPANESLGQVAQVGPQERQSVPSQISEGLSRPIWVGDNLLLARRVVRNGQTEVQGTLLDWPGLRDELLTEAKDVFPSASLGEVRDPAREDPTRMLAGLPVYLNPGVKLIGAELSAPMQWALGIGWGALALALASSAVLLAGVVGLSERRAAFVSSVTHELRTPLTTFRMYSDMLARGMVPEGSRRQEYLETLRREAERLTHLVENVLSYARLERGRAVNRHELVTVDQLVDRYQTRLAERAQEANMQFVVTVADHAHAAQLETDVGVVEQILFNLVDNAAKYAQSATDRRIHFEVARSAAHVTFTIRDHGPGFTKPGRAQKSQPFSKTAEEAAVTAPGVGLGLALCRRLAKQLGGRLDVVNSPGVAATLRLPLRI